MSDLNIQLDPVVPTRTNWNAIWAGVFTFFAIWSVLGALCMAIWAGSARLSLALAVGGIILTIVAMFVAGRTTARLAGVSNPSEGVTYGMTLFGLTAVSTVVISSLAASIFAGGAAHASAASYVIDMFSEFGWPLFVGLFLGWLAAIGGASTAHRKLAHPTPVQQQVRHA